MNGICHIEIPCTDIDRAMKFYTDVFGWETRLIPEMNYGVFKAPDGPGGGFSRELKIAAEGGLALYIEVEDINAVFGKVEAAGGKKVMDKAMISPEHGFMGQFSDIEGNLIGLWSQK